MKATKEYPYIEYTGETFDSEEMIKRSKAFYERMDERRSVRDYSDQHIPKEVIENIIMSASTAPSGAHKQPWTFCLISNTALKAKIREAAEQEEFKSYNGRMPEDWIEDLAPLGTDWHKEFIDIAPWIIIVMKRSYEFVGDKKRNNYYVSESVGIASGMLLTAIHNAGLVSLTHTPSPMNFISKILDRPANEKPFLLIPVGYPKKGAQIPDIKRKDKQDVIEYYE